MILSSMSVTLETKCTVEARASAGSAGARRTRGDSRPWPMWGGSYTVGPHTYMTDRPRARVAGARATCARGGVVEAQHPARYGTAASRRSAGRRPTHPSTGRPAVAWSGMIPDKPTLDGLEAGWARALGARRHLPLRPRPQRPDATRSSPSTPRRRPCRARSTWARSSATPRPTPSPAIQRMRGRNVFYPMGWDDNGLATERRVQNYFGVRCDPTLPYDPDFAPPYRGDVPEATHREVPVSRPNFVALCEQLTARTRRPSRSSFRRLGLSVDWTTPLHHHRRPQPPGQPAWPSCTTWPAARPTAPTPRPCGTSTSAPRSPRPRSRTASGPAPTTASPSTAPRRRPCVDRHDPARAARRLRRPRRPPRRRALPAAVRHDRAHAAVRRRGAGGGPPAGRARQGHGHRHDLHLRRHHRRHVVARARPAHAQRHRARRPLPRGGRRRGSTATPGAPRTPSWPARR